MAKSAVGNSATTPFTRGEASLRSQGRRGVAGFTPDLIPQKTAFTASTPQATQTGVKSSSVVNNQQRPT